MQLHELLKILKEKQITLDVVKGKLKISAAKGSMSAEILDAIKENKNSLVTLLAASKVSPDHVVERIKPFQLLHKKVKDQLPAEVVDAYPITALQSGMVFHTQVSQNNLQYLEIGCYQIEGVYNKASIKKAWGLMVNRHAVLRTAFDFSSYEIPLQLVYAPGHEPIKVIDLSKLTVKQQNEKMALWFEQEKSLGIDIQKAPLWRMTMHKLDKNNFSIGLSFHHAILDGWSLAALLAEFVQLYGALIKGKEPEIVPLPIDYKDFVALELKSISSKEDQAFWLNEVFDVESMILPKWPLKKGFKPKGVANIPIKLNKEQSKDIMVIAKDLAISLDALLLAGHLRVMSFISGRKDVLSGVVYNGRPEQEYSEKVLGLFLNSLPVRMSIEDISWKDFILSVFKKKQAIYKHRRYPLIEINRLANNNDLFEVLFNYTHFDISEETKDASEIKIVGGESFEETNFPLVFQCNVSLGELGVSLAYDSSVFPIKQMEIMAKAYKNVFLSIIDDLDLDETQNLLLGEQRQQILVDWNDTKADYPKDKTIYQLFEEQVKKTPNNTAVVFEDQELTYGELNERANQLARLIRTKYKQQNKRDLKPDSLIGLCVERSLDMIVGILGILKAGAAYVPLDPDYPQDRLEYMIKDSHEGLIITQQDVVARDGFLDKLHHDELLVIDSDHIKEELKKQSKDNLKAISGPSDLAYVIYTSGSTGRPKGVMIEHQSVINVVSDYSQLLSADANKCFLSVTSMNFDIFVLEYVLPLCNGCQCVMVSESTKRDMGLLKNLFSRHQPDFVQGTPSMWTVLVEHLPKPNNPLTILTGGERLSNGLKDKLIKIADKVYNVYGPTEATIWSTYTHCQKNQRVSIGKPLSNTLCFVLDTNNNPCPIGTPGELYIGGAGLARGYLNQEKLTKECFIDNPFVKELGLPRIDRIYKTGDLVRWLPDGNIEYLGRTDFQVKIRGFRIELGEIENVLAKYTSISQVCVVAKDKDNQKYLAAYYVLAKVKSAPSTDELRANLSEILPDYMVPAVFVKLDEMPLTPNGKINRRALPDPDMSLMGEEYIAPRNEIEQQLANIWCDVLKLEQIGIHDNFFHLGGHSLLATQLASRIHAKLNCDIPIKALFDKPKLIDLASFIGDAIKGGTGEAYTSIKNIKRLKYGNKMSFAQERLWFLDQFEGSNENYNIPVVLRLSGKLNVKALNASINQLIARQDSFRTVFLKDKHGDGRQKIVDTLQIKLKVEKIKGKALEKALHQEVHTPFNLETGPLIRVRLFEVKREGYVLVFNHHHIISDGWSVDLILSELSEFYSAIVEKRPPYFEPLSIQYVDFSAWQRDKFKKPAYQDKLNYWKDYLAGYEDLPLTIDKPRPTHFSYKGASINFSLDKDLSSQITELAKEHGTTLYIVLLMAFNVLMSRYSGQEDVIIGSPIANRHHHDIDNLVGFFVNTLVLRNQVDGDKSVKELLDDVSSNALNAFEHQEVPFEQIVEVLDVPRDTSRNPIIQVMFSLQSFGSDASGNVALNLPGIKIEPFTETSFDVARFDLSLFLEESSNGIVGSFNYCTDLFHQDSIDRMARNFERLLISIVEDSAKKVKDLRLLTDERRQKILVDWNNTSAPYPKDKTIYQLFEEQVEKTPNNTAVVFEDEELTYKELNQQANQLARLIRAKYKQQNKKDLKPDSLIGLCVERSLDMIIGLLGILKAGAAYVPLDPDYPQDRIEYMIKDSHEGLIITQKVVVARDGFLDKLHHDELLVIDSDNVKLELKNQSNTNLKVNSGPSDLAYVIYTSGSTGLPKGVMIEQQSVSNYINWLSGYLNLRGRTHVDCSSNFSFDFTVSVSLAVLIKGHKVCLCSDVIKKDLSLYTQHLINNKISLAKLTPGYLTILLEHVKTFSTKLPLTKIILGGEALKIEDVKEWLALNPDTKFYNEYGPTEATVGASQYIYSQQNCELSTVGGVIGHPGSNICFYVLDNSQNPCPIGTPGELYIGGAGLARGYLNQKELTRERFIPNPFAKELKLPETDRIYKTGDLVRWLPDGNIEYLGRTDFQVKIRGFRIELGEIENVLSKHNSISQVCVAALNKDNQKYLAAYYVLAQNIPEPEIDELRSYLSETLPDYMVPSAFVKLDEMPLTPNGKINRKALPDPDMTLMGEEYVAPSNEIEQQLAGIWCDVLKLKQIGIHDNFFSMGGDSIISIQLVSRCREHDIYFTPKDLFQNPTIAKLSLIDLKGSVVEAEQGLVKGNAPLIPIQQWFFEEHYTYQNHWNQAQLLQVNESLDIKVLEKSIATLIHHHDGLRLRYKQKTNKAYQQYYDSQPSAMDLKIKKINLEKINHDKQATHITEHCSKLQGGLDITNGPVIAVAVFTGLSDGNDRLLIAIHHLMVDGVSWRVIIPDLQSCYDQIKSGVEVKLSPKTSSFQRWGQALKTYTHEKASDDLDYWLDVIDHIKPLTLDNDIKQDYATKMDGLHLSLDRRLTDVLLNKTQPAYNTEINDLLLSAFSLALAKWQHTETVSFNLEGHGREEVVSNVDITRTVGWFTSVFPVVLKLPCLTDKNDLSEDDVKACIQTIKEQLRHIPDKGLSFGALKYAHKDKKVRAKLANGSASKISFNYLGQFGAEESSEGAWTFAKESSGTAVDPRNHHPNLLDLNGAIINGQLGFSVAFSTDHFSKKTIKAFSTLFKDYLAAIINHCSAQEITRYTPSDFPTAEISQTALDAILHRSHVDKLYALSPLQEGMLFHALHATESDQYCVQLEWIYEGPLNVKALQESWQGLIDHHDILRTQFIWQGVDKPVQAVEKEVKLPWFQEDYSKLNEKDQGKKVQAYLQKDRLSGFDLTQPCLMRLHLIKLAKDRYHFIWTNHHILLDGWCNPILLTELVARYGALTKGKKPVIVQSPPYARYIEWIYQQDVHEAKQFWIEQLSDIESATDIRVQKPGVILDPNKPIKDLGSIGHVFDASATQAIEDCVKAEAVTVNSLVQLAFANILSRYSGDSKVIYGSTLSGRSHDLYGIDKMIGLLITTLPMAIRIEAEKTVSEHLKKTHQMVQEVNHYSYCGISEVQRYSGVQSGNPLFNVLFVFENYPAGDVGDDETDLVISNVQGHVKNNYPLSVMAYISEGKLQLKMGYDRDCFEDETIKTVLKHMVNFINRAVEDVSILISKVKILEERERQKILVDWNNTSASYPKDKTIYQLFEEQVVNTPNNTAVVFEDQELTYGELNARANQLARLIRTKYKQQNKKDLKPDSLIGLCVERSFDMIIGILGILKAGAAYVPLDPDYPQDRLEYMIKDSHEGLIITQKVVVARDGFLDKLHHDELLVIDSDQVKAELKKQSNANLKVISGPNDLAYVIYTSGSTGRPKGTMLEHKGIVNQITWMNDNHGCNESDVVLNLISFGFDGSVRQFFSPLLSGGSVVLLSNERSKDPSLWINSVNKARISMIHMVPTMFRYFLDELKNTKCDDKIVKCLKRITCGAEPLTVSLYNDFKLLLPHSKLYNHYGPTEASANVSQFFCNNSESYVNTIPIGKPIKNIQLYVLDNNLNPCPIGTPGELYIGGVGLARGYLNKEKSTKESFIPNPFADELGLPKTDRIYKTGDLVRWLPDGNIEYLGRTDFQVKIRGFRIELGEIENVLSKHNRISQVCVVSLEKDNQKYLAAYYVPTKGKSAPSIDELRTYLSETLPDYMVPTAFVELDEMPLTPNGKINRQALPDPDMSLMGEDYVAPRNEMEQKLADIWCQVLKLEQIGIHDNFFHLGGHSLLATQLVSRIYAKLNCDIPIKALFDKPQLIDLALLIEDKLKEGKGEAYTPIKRVKRLKGGHAMSFAQERLWFLDQFEGSNENYNIPIVVRLNGNLNINALQQSCNQLMVRQDSFRTVFVKNKQGKGRQKVLDTLHIDLKVERLKSKALKKAIRDEVHTPFDLEKGPLMRVRLFEATQEQFILVINHHHIISDGWSINVITKELSELYGAAVDKREPELAPLPIQYVDFTAWQRAEFKKPSFQDKLTFWKDYLAGYENLPLPIDKSRPASFSYQGANVPFNLDKDLSEQLVLLAKDHGTTLYIVLLMAFNILMSRYSGQEDVIIGSPIANRYHHDIENIVGFFVNTLVLRNNIDSDKSIHKLLAEISANALNAFEHQEVPFEQLVEILGVVRDPSRNPIIQVMFSLQSFGSDASGNVALNLPGIKIEPFTETSLEVAKFDLSLFLEESSNGIVGSFNYCTDLFHRDSIDRMARNFEKLLTSIVEDSAKKVKDLRLLTDERRQQILVDWNDTAAPYPKDKTIYQLFEEQVTKTPNNTAVVFENQELTYGELNAKANQLARLIRDKCKQQNKKDLKPDSLIGLCVVRSLDMIIGILGILKAGAAYVPLDPDYPQDRLEYMIKDSHEGLIITQKAVVARNGFLDKLHYDELLVIDSDEVKEQLKKQSNANLKALSGPNDLAYVIYTSGSTGKPKGVLLPHHNVIRLLLATKEEYRFNDKDVWTMLHSYAFDFSVWEIWGALLHGGKLIVVPYMVTLDPEQFYNLVRKQKVSVLNQTPGAFQLFISVDNKQKKKIDTLRYVIFGGDVLNIEILSPWWQNHPDDNPLLVNMYGITETTVHVTYGSLNKQHLKEHKAGFIGRKIKDLQAYIMDNNLNPCPIGTPGELYIGGAGLARGYLNQKELTRERFIPNPFAKELKLSEADRIYKTGDLVRWLPDGNIEYIGRTDFQVKIRGFRIELGEIENTLGKHERISQVCVVSLEKDNQKYLAAYYVPTKGKSAPSIDELRTYLSETLPDYMVPTAFVELDEMPLTPNGKINRQALPDPDMSLMGEDYVAPRNEMEQKLADIWCQVLKLEQIGIHDNFFHLGGHSLLATQLVSRIHAKLNCDIPIRALFEKPKLMDLALLIEDKLKEGKGEAYTPIKRVKRLKGGHAMSFAQQRLWFLDQFEGSNENYNIPIVVRLNGNLNINALQQSCNQLMVRQDSFRTVFVKNKQGKGRQKVLDTLHIDLKVEQLTSKALEQAIRDEVHTPFDLEKGPLIRVRLFETTQEQFILVINHHHIISDGWSINVITKELSELYGAAVDKRKPELDPLLIQYVDFTAWQRAEFKKPAFQDKLTFWKDYLAGYEDLPLPIDKSRPASFSYQGANVHFNLDKDLSEQLALLAKDHGTTLYIVLLMAFNILMSRYSGQEDVIIGSPIANRYHHDIENIVGFFVNTLVLRNNIDSDKSIHKLLAEISANALNAFEHQEVPFEQLVEILGVVRDPSRNPIIQVMFSLQSFGADASGEMALNFPDIDVKPFTEGSFDVAKFDLSLFLEESSNGIVGSFNYCTDLFHQDSIDRMARNFERLLTSIVEDSTKKVKDLRLLTDERRQQILVDWNDTAAPYPKDKTIYQLFEEQVERTPYNTAVVFEDDQLTYSELNARANQLARLIRTKYKQQNKRDLKPDGLIGLCVERSLDMIIGILGILKAGAAYVPLDPDYPQDRLEYMIEDSHEGLIITLQDIVARDGFLDKLHHDELLVMDSDKVKAELKKQSKTNLKTLSGPNDLAYVIYTSGSTGRPKGVMIEHQSVINVVSDYSQLLSADANKCFLSVTSMNFDIFVLEYVLPLCNGCQCVMVSESTKRDMGLLKNLFSRHQPDFVQGTPSMWTVLVEHLPKLKNPLTILTGGERLSNGLKDKLIKIADKVYNVYGPTEATIWSTYTHCQKNQRVSIGKPLSNTLCFVLDANSNPCPIGTPGELHIGGAGLARGYLNQEELTKERFIPNPFADELGLPKTDRIYKTGDLVRWLPDGNIEYLGRTDFQVKIRGFRIELGEIENTLGKHESISQVCVVSLEKDNQKYLAAYYVLAQGKVEPEIDELRAYLSETLPDYMVPFAFVKLDEMPLTPNGKINRKALPDPDMSLMGEEYIAPRNETEQKLADIWCDILKVDQVGVHDNFFYLGGNSLLLIQFISRIKQAFGLTLSLAWSFKNITISQQALSITKRDPSLKGYDPIVTIKMLRGHIPLFLIHPGLGGAEAYLKMGDLFKNNKQVIDNVYAVDSYNFSHLDDPIINLELLAKKYIEYIKMIQPEGPYFLGGWSLGGTIAFECAKQLIKNGKTVLGIYLIDTNGLSRNMWGQLQALDPNDYTFVKNLKESGVGKNEIGPLLKIHRIEGKLLSTYSLSKIEDTEIILLEALNRLSSPNREVDLNLIKTDKLIRLPKKGWDRYTNNLTVHEFDADHQSIMKGEHLKRVVKIIEEDMSSKIKEINTTKKKNKK